MYYNSDRGVKAVDIFLRLLAISLDLFTTALVVFIGPIFFHLHLWSKRKRWRWRTAIIFIIKYFFLLFVGCRTHEPKAGGRSGYRRMSTETHRSVSPIHHPRLIGTCITHHHPVLILQREGTTCLFLPLHSTIHHQQQKMEENVDDCLLVTL